MHEAPPDFEVYRSPRDEDDPPADWVTRAAKMPIRLYLAALLCPIILHNGIGYEMVYQWSSLGGGPVDDSKAEFIVYLPWVAAVLFVASRFTRPPIAAALCGGAGALFWTTVAIYTHWLVGVIVGCILFIAVGNRVAKLDLTRLAPRLMAGIGGVTLLGLGFLSIGPNMTIYQVMFSGDLWKHAWPGGLLLLSTALLAAAGIGVAVSRYSRLCKVATSVLSRVVVLGAPIALLALGAQLPGLGRMGGDNLPLILTVGFKMLGSMLALLTITGLGLASLLAMWLASTDGDADFSDDGFTDDGEWTETPARDDWVAQDVRS